MCNHGSCFREVVYSLSFVIALVGLLGASPDVRTASEKPRDVVASQPTEVDPDPEVNATSTPTNSSAEAPSRGR